MEMCGTCLEIAKKGVCGVCGDYKNVRHVDLETLDALTVDPKKWVDEKLSEYGLNVCAFCNETADDNDSVCSGCQEYKGLMPLNMHSIEYLGLDALAWLEELSAR